jgi:hypothetical protein
MRELVKRLCADDPEAVDLIDQATQNPASRHIDAFDNVQGIAPTGNTSQAALRRLRKDRPDLHEQGENLLLRQTVCRTDCPESGHAFATAIARWPLVM